VNDLRVLSNGMVLYQMPFAATPVFSIIERNEIVIPETPDAGFTLNTTNIVKVDFSLVLRGEEKARKLRGFAIELDSSSGSLSKSSFFENLDEKARETLREAIKSFKKNTSRLKDAKEKDADELDENSDDTASDIERYQAKIEMARRKIVRHGGDTVKHKGLDQSDLIDLLVGEFEIEADSVDQVIDKCLSLTHDLFREVDDVPMLPGIGDSEEKQEEQSVAKVDAA